MKFNIENKESTTHLTLAGSIDEDADFTQIKVSAGSELQVHLQGVTSINSCGIREWIKWFSTVDSKKITFFECPKVIVDQMNIVQGFLPAKSLVQSFFVPYFNEESGAEKSLLFSLGTEFDQSGKLTLPEVKDAQGQEMEMDVIEAKYFKFIKKIILHSA